MTFKTLITLMFLGYFAFGQVHVDILCADTFPTTPEVCPDIYEPVCANYPRECVTTPCPQYKDFSNACFACSDPNVQSYFEGTCYENGEWGSEEEWSEEMCTEEWCSEEEWTSEDFQGAGGRIYCDGEIDPEAVCPDVYEPVCGYFNIPGFGTTYTNSCNACQLNGVDYYYPGACE